MLTAQIIAAVLLVLGSTLVLHTVIQADRRWAAARPRRSIAPRRPTRRTEMPARRAA